MKMTKRILVLGFAVLATSLLAAAPVQAARKHLIVVHSSNNTGEGVVTVDKAKLHPVPQAGGAEGECAKAVCGKTYAQGTRVTLTATPAPGSTFAGWGGDCEGTAPTCTVRLRRSLDVMVHFTK
jgi:Divergent InlB B-repeat domain